jgi:hypothetical protein
MIWLGSPRYVVVPSIGFMPTAEALGIHDNKPQVLRLVHSTLEEGIKTAGSSIIQSSLEALPQLVEQCTMVHEEANGLMAALKPSTGKDSSISFFQRMKFVFYKGRITILRSLLDSSKSTLNLLLVTLNIEMAKNKKPDKAWMYVHTASSRNLSLTLGKGATSE